jgi:hypothetical protein
MLCHPIVALYLAKKKKPREEKVSAHEPACRPKPCPFVRFGAGLRRKMRSFLSVPGASLISDFRGSLWSGCAAVVAVFDARRFELNVTGLKMLLDTFASSLVAHNHVKGNHMVLRDMIAHVC